MPAHQLYGAYFGRVIAQDCHSVRKLQERTMLMTKKHGAKCKNVILLTCSKDEDDERHVHGHNNAIQQAAFPC